MRDHLDSVRRDGCFYGNLEKLETFRGYITTAEEKFLYVSGVGWVRRNGFYTIPTGTAYFVIGTYNGNKYLVDWVL